MRLHIDKLSRTILISYEDLVLIFLCASHKTLFGQIRIICYEPDFSIWGVEFSDSTNTWQHFHSLKLDFPTAVHCFKEFTWYSKVRATPGVKGQITMAYTWRSIEENVYLHRVIISHFESRSLCRPGEDWEQACISSVGLDGVLRAWLLWVVKEVKPSGFDSSWLINNNTEIIILPTNNCSKIPKH